MHLLLLEPGTIQSHPDMGVGIVSKYRYMHEDSLPDLLADFRKQINTYIPGFEGISINGEIHNKVVYLTAIINQTIYGFTFDTETTKMNNTVFNKLSDL